MADAEVNSPAEGVENKVKYYCCCGFQTDQHNKGDDPTNQDTDVVQESPVTQQPMTSQPLRAPEEVSSDPENKPNVSASQKNGLATQNNSQPNRYKSVKEYMKVENFMNDFFSQI